MIGHKHSTTIAALVGVLLYFLIKRGKVEINVDHIVVSVPCQRAFERLTNVQFVKKINEQIVDAIVLSESDDDGESTTTRMRIVERIPYYGTIEVENEMKAFIHNHTIFHRTKILYGYLVDVFVVWELREHASRPNQCIIKYRDTIWTPLAFKSFVEKQATYAHKTVSIPKMVKLLNEES